MRSQWLIVDPDTESGFRRRKPERLLINATSLGNLRWLAVTMLLLSGGCITPCFNGVCNSKESLYVSPMARFGSVERKVPECGPSGCKSMPYFTFGKYWPFMDQWKTTKAATSCARKNLWKQMWETKRWINAHYRAGFTKAFVDVANGGNGELPPVPPPQYWNAHFRSSKGQWRADRWFDGYRAGAAMALVQMQPLRRITASYDWSIEKPREPFVTPTMGLNNGCGIPGGGGIIPSGGFMPGPQGYPDPQGYPGPPGGPQGFPYQSGPGGGYSNQPLSPGYGQAPNQFGPSDFGYAPQSPHAGAGGAPQPQLYPSPPPAGPQGQVPRGAAAPNPGLNNSTPVPGVGASAGQPGGGAAPGTNSLVPGHGGVPGNSATQAPGGRSAAPVRMLPGFSPNANRPAGIPRDDPVWRTRPPQPNGR